MKSGTGHIHNTLQILSLSSPMDMHSIAKCTEYNF